MVNKKPKRQRRGGRKPGTPNKRTTKIGVTLDQVVPDKQLVQLLWKLALGGDAKCATYLADRKWGRIPQPLEHSGRNGDPVKLILVEKKEYES